MNERRREIAILRALGARRQTILCSIVLEAGAIAALGMIVAFVIYGIIISSVAAIVRTETGVVLDPTAWHPVMLWAPVGMILVSALAGLIPAIKAYRTDVAEHLAPLS
jgi:putative ABC transport system permease protein